MTTTPTVMLELANLKIDEVTCRAAMTARPVGRDAARKGHLPRVRQRIGALLIGLGRRLGGTMTEARVERSGAA